jgi:hypothetical protein
MAMSAPVLVDPLVDLVRIDQDLGRPDVLADVAPRPGLEIVHVDRVIEPLVVRHLADVAHDGDEHALADLQRPHHRVLGGEAHLRQRVVGHVAELVEDGHARGVGAVLLAGVDHLLEPGVAGLDVAEPLVPPP